MTVVLGSGRPPKIYHLGAQATVCDRLLLLGTGIPERNVSLYGVSQLLLGIRLQLDYNEILRRL